MQLQGDVVVVAKRLGGVFQPFYLIFPNGNVIIRIISLSHNEQSPLLIYSFASKIYTVENFIIYSPGI